MERTEIVNTETEKSIEKDNILISVVIPVHNTEKYLPKCLDSVLNQNYKNIEIIVVNDASLGNCNEIVNDYIKKYDNIKLIENKNNLGLYNSRLIGIKEVKGKYVMHVDSDDYLTQNSLSELIEIINEDDYDIIAFNYLVEDSKGRIYEAPPQNKILEDKILTTLEEKYFNLFHDCLSESNATKIFKRELYTRLDLVNTNLVFQEDYFAIVRLLFNSKSVRLIPKAYYMYYQREDSATKFRNMNYKQRVKTLEDLRFVNESVIKFFKDKNLNYCINYINDREIEYYNWIYNDIISNLNENEEKIIKDLIIKAFPFISSRLKIIEKMSKNQSDNCYISIIIPVYNTEKYLKRCLDSIVGQSFKDIEVIIVDDCSSGNCFEIAEEYKKNHKNIKYIRNSENLGSAWSRLNGLSEAVGEYIHFEDSDDWVEKECYQKIYKYLGHNYDCLHFNGIYAYSDKTTKKIDFQIAQNMELSGERRAFDDMFFNDARRRVLWSRVFRKNCVIYASYSMPKNHISVCDDWILNLFSLFYVRNYKSVSDIFYYYYQDNPNAMTAIVENRAKSKVSTDKMNNILRQTYICYQALSDFLKWFGLWEIYKPLWQLYITRDIRYMFIIPYSNYEEYILDLLKTDKEAYIEESSKFFNYEYVKVSSILKWIQHNLYESNGGYIDYYNKPVLNSEVNQIKYVNRYNIIDFILSVENYKNYLSIIFFGIRIRIKYKMFVDNKFYENKIDKIFSIYQSNKYKRITIFGIKITIKR